MMYKKLSMNYNFEDRKRIVFFINVLLTVLAGLYFRLKGLGKWPLAVDEYYIAQSVRNIKVWSAKVSSCRVL